MNGPGRMHFRLLGWSSASLYAYVTVLMMNYRTMSVKIYTMSSKNSQSTKTNLYYTCNIQLCNMPGIKANILPAPILSSIIELCLMYGQVVSWVINGASVLITINKSLVIHIHNILFLRSDVFPQDRPWIRCMTLYCYRFANSNKLVLMVNI